MNGGESSANAQLDFGGSRPFVALPSNEYGSNSTEASVAALYSSTVVTSASGSSPSCAASATSVAAVTGSSLENTVSVNPSTDRLVWSAIRNAAWSWLC